MWVEREQEEGETIPKMHQAAMVCFYPSFDIPFFANKVFFFFFLKVNFIFSKIPFLKKRNSSSSLIVLNPCKREE